MAWTARLTVLLLGLTAGAAYAGQCGYAYCWGAVAVGPNGAWGYSTSSPTEDQAVSRVEAECPDCDNIQTFYNTCAAIAEAPDGAWGSGWGDTRDLAEFYAVQTCEDFGSGCQMSVWACSF